MNRLPRTLMAALIAFAPAAAFAQGPHPCVTQANTLEINACAQEKFQAADKRLNAAYQVILKLLDGGGNGPATKKALVDAQRKWVAFRDADCKAQASVYQGGTIAPSVYMECMIAHADARTKALQPASWTGG